MQIKDNKLLKLLVEDTYVKPYNLTHNETLPWIYKVILKVF